MAKFIIDDPVVTIDGDDHSDHIRSATIEASFAEVDLTAFGQDFSEIGLGVGDATITLEAYQDFASNELDQNMWPIFITKDIVEVTVKPTAAVVSATNPEYSLPEARLSTYTPLGGAKGDASMTTLTFRNAGQQGLVRAFT
jgi:hypothetical protein